MPDSLISTSAFTETAPNHPLSTTERKFVTLNPARHIATPPATSSMVGEDSWRCNDLPTGGHTPLTAAAVPGATRPLRRSP